MCKRSEDLQSVGRLVNRRSPVYALRLMFRGDLLLRHIRTLSLPKHRPDRRISRVRQGTGSSSLVSLTKRCTRSDSVNICSMQFHTSTASGEDRPDFSKMANRFKQERVQQGKRRRWKDGVQNGGGRRWRTT